MGWNVGRGCPRLERRQIHTLVHLLSMPISDGHLLPLIHTIFHTWMALSQNSEAVSVGFPSSLGSLQLVLDCSCSLLLLDRMEEIIIIIIIIIIK